jgi:signal transduction histidine kinase
VEDLRDLARNIYPTVLAERGLASALNDLARRARGPVDVEAAPDARLPEVAELAAYLVVSEALAGLADGAEARVSATATGHRLVVEVRGAGLDGEQLERLGERVAALEGSLETGRGGDAPTVSAVIPIVID